MSELDLTESNIEKQLTEIEILKSIYPNDNEFIIEDQDAIFEAQLYLSNKNKTENAYRRNIGFIIRINADIKNNKTKSGEDQEDSYYQLPLEIVCRLPVNYPLQQPPNVFVRCSKQNINRKFPEELSNYINSSYSNDCSILDIIEWIKENIVRFLSDANNSNKSQIISQFVTFTRIWIYSHHIYSMEKRRNILQWAEDANLKGFSKPGKPGIICVEGEHANTQEFLTRLRGLSWQKLQVKETESFQVETTKLQDAYKFDNFEEKFFVPKNETNIDIGLLFAFLKEKGFQNIFNLYFGVDGKLPSMPTTVASNQTTSSPKTNNNNIDT